WNPKFMDVDDAAGSTRCVSHLASIVRIGQPCAIDDQLIFMIAAGKVNQCFENTYVVIKTHDVDVCGPVVETAGDADLNVRLTRLHKKNALSGLPHAVQTRDIHPLLRPH